MYELNHSEDKNCECTSVVEKYIEVRTPIILDTKAEIDDITYKCEKPEITCCTKKNCSNNYVYEFVIKQVLKVKVPIKYSTEANILIRDSEEC